jgi:hypothetical protein
MRTILAATAATLALALLAGPASAQQIPQHQWCAVDSENGDVGSCAYSSMQQCLLAFNQTSGICYENPDYKPALAAQPAKKPRVRRS